MKSIIVGITLILASAGLAFAHSPVNTSNPADGTTLADVPEVLTLTLAEPGRFMRVEVTHTTEDGSTTHTEDLDIPSRATTNVMDFTPTSMGPGTYLVEWRVLGADGHAMDGTVTYIVTGQ
ncbi:MAG: copper resistance protein CopC [Pseudomonadota bacterium]